MAFALSLALTVAVATPAPSPVPSGLPVIAHVKTQAACNALRQLSFPMAAITAHNDAAFRGIDVDMVKFVGGFSALDAPTAQELEAALAPPNATLAPSESELSNPGEEVQQGLDSPGAQNGPNEDLVTFNGKSILAAANIQTVVAQIFQNLTLADSLMKQSWKEYPAGTDPAYDALRQRVQNLIDLQRALANQYAFFTGTYLNSSDPDTASMLSPPASSPQQEAQETTNYKALLRAIAMGESSALVSAFESRGASSQKALENVRELKTIGSPAAIVNELRNQEHAFVSEVGVQFKKCAAP